MIEDECGAAACRAPRRAARRGFSSAASSRSRSCTATRAPFAWIEDARRDAGLCLAAAAPQSAPGGDHRRFARHRHRRQHRRIHASRTPCSSARPRPSPTRRAGRHRHAPRRRRRSIQSPIRSTSTSSGARATTDSRTSMRRRAFPQALSLTIPGRPSGAVAGVRPLRVAELLRRRSVSRPRRGGWFGADDRARNRSVVSDRFRPHLVRRRRRGRTDWSSLNGETFAITGVLPEGFHGPSLVAADLWLPLLTAPMAHAVGSPHARQSRRRLAGHGRPAESGVVDAGGRTPSSRRSAATSSARHPANGAARVLRAVPSSLVPGNRAVTGVLLSILMALDVARAPGRVRQRVGRPPRARRRTTAGDGGPPLDRRRAGAARTPTADGDACCCSRSERRRHPRRARPRQSVDRRALPALPVSGRGIACRSTAVCSRSRPALSLAAALMSGLMPAIRASRVDPAVGAERPSRPAPRAAPACAASSSSGRQRSASRWCSRRHSSRAPSCERCRPIPATIPTASRSFPSTCRWLAPTTRRTRHSGARSSIASGSFPASRAPASPWRSRAASKRGGSAVAARGTAVWQRAGRVRAGRQHRRARLLQRRCAFRSSPAGISPTPTESERRPSSSSTNWRPGTTGPGKPPSGSI